MNKRGFRRIAVFASTAALAGGASRAAAPTPPPTAAAVAAQQQSGQPPQGGGMDFTALAKALGVTTAKLQAAMQKNMPQPGEQPRVGQMTWPPTSRRNSA